MTVALSISQTVALRKILKSGMKVASLGYPDTIAPLSLFNEMLGEMSTRLTYRKDSEKICNRHGIPTRLVPDAESFFSLMGCKLVVYDIIEERGCEVLLDLNEKLDPILKAYNYDLVLDVGTVEHCFNIAQAIKNMASMVKVGGFIIHENPFNCANHGFYNLNPTFFVDFYESNGFKIVDCKLVSKKGEEMKIPRTKRFEYEGQELNVFTLAQRIQDKTFINPVQSRYANQITEAA